MSGEVEDQAGRRPVVLVVGPFSASGGMAAVCRHMQERELARRWRVVPVDNAKRTPPDRSPAAAVGAHLWLLVRLIAAIIRHRPALVHIHTCSYWTFYRSVVDLLVARLLRRPVVLHIHGGHFHEFVAALGGLRRRFVVTSLRSARRIIVVGEIWKQRLGAVVGHTRIRVVLNGVPLPERRRAARRRRPLRVIGIGDLSEGKAPEDLIEAVARLSPRLRGRVRVEWIGPTPPDSPERRAYLERLIRQRGLSNSVRLLGRLTPARTQARLRRADVHALTSRGEGLPMVLLEAMGWGLPSVVTRVGAIPEVVTDGADAFVIEPGDVNALTERLTRLLSSDELRARMGRTAARRARAAYTLGRFHAALDQVWSEMLAKVGSVRAFLGAQRGRQLRSPERGGDLDVCCGHRPYGPVEESSCGRDALLSHQRRFAGG